MSPAAPVPDVDEVRRIAAIADPVLRNLEITACYSRLAAAVAGRVEECSNWCTFATWASRQAGRTVRGEDLLAGLEHELGRDAERSRPSSTACTRASRPTASASYARLSFATSSSASSPTRIGAPSSSSSPTSRSACTSRRGCKAEDWAQLTQRMHYIAHLFRAYHEIPALGSAPFTAAQLERIRAGAVPDGEL